MSVQDQAQTPPGTEAKAPAQAASGSETGAETRTKTQPAPSHAERKPATSSRIVAFEVNGERREVIVRPADTLLHTLRRELGLTGAKPGCENGDCGTCTVLVDGWPIKSCMMLSLEAEGKPINTVEGLEGTPIQQAFLDHWAFQCGYCTSGFLMVGHALSQIHPDADEHAITEWLQSNICRCTGYEEIRRAVHQALAQVRAARHG